MAVVLEPDLEAAAEVGGGCAAALRADAVHDEASFGQAEAAIEFGGVEEQEAGFGALPYFDVRFDLVG